MIESPVGEGAATKVLLDADAIQRTLSRIAHEIIERNPDLDRVALVGIHTRGVSLALRLRRLVEERAGVEVATGAVDATTSNASAASPRSRRRRMPAIMHAGSVGEGRYTRATFKPVQRGRKGER